MCYQTQRYTMYKDDNLVFQTFQVNCVPGCALASPAGEVDKYVNPSLSFFMGQNGALECAEPQTLNMLV